MRSRANWPGISAPSLLSNTARTRTVPLLASTWLSTSCSRPSNGVSARARACPSAPGCARAASRALAPLGRSRSARGDDLLVGVEAGVDRAHRHQRRQHRRARAGGDQVADRDLDAADAARDRRAHLGVAEVQLRRSAAPPARRAGWRRPRAARCCARRTRAARSRARRAAAAPRSNSLRRVGDARLGRGDLRLRRARPRPAYGAGSIDEQQVALGDERAFAEVHRLHRAGDARADVDALDGLEAAGELVPGRDLAADDGGDRHRHGSRGGRRRLGAGVLQSNQGDGSGDERQGDGTAELQAVADEQVADGSVSREGVSGDDGMAGSLSGTRGHTVMWSLR